MSDAAVAHRACKSRARKRGWGQLGAGGPYTPCYHIELCFVLVVIIELSRNSVFQLSFPKDYYKQKQWNILPVTMITEIMNFNRVLWWLPWQ